MKTFPHPNVTLSDPSPAECEGTKGNRSRNSSPGMSRRSRNVSRAMCRKSSVVSWSDSPREQSEANGEDAVMEDGTETHQAEINKKIKADDKLRKILTNMPKEHKTLIYADSFKSKMESLDDETAVLLAAKKGNSHPCKVGSTNRKTIWSESRKRSNRNKKCLEILKTWIEADLELEAANAKQMQAKQEMALLVAEQSAEHAKTVDQVNPGFQCRMSGSISDQVAQHTVLPVFKSVLSTQSTECHAVSEQLAHGGWRD